MWRSQCGLFRLDRPKGERYDTANSTDRIHVIAERIPGVTARIELESLSDTRGRKFPSIYERLY
jgi:hypothetical protein